MRYFILWADFQFSQGDPYCDWVHPKNIFPEKIARHMKKPSLPEFQLSECFIYEMGPKTKKGETKKWFMLIERAVVAAQSSNIRSGLVLTSI